MSAVLREALSVLMRRRPAAGSPQGCNWREDWRHERVLPAGTVLYKGTSDPDVTPSEPSPFTWFTTERSLARSFSVLYEDSEEETEDFDPVPLVHEYVVERDLCLPLIRSESQISRFFRLYGISGDYVAKTRADVMASGLPGWVALGRYPKWGGDDILVGDVDSLGYRRSFDRDGNDIGKVEPKGTPSPRC